MINKRICSIICKLFARKTSIEACAEPEIAETSAEELSGVVQGLSIRIKCTAKIVTFARAINVQYKFAIAEINFEPFSPINESTCFTINPSVVAQAIRFFQMCTPLPSTSHSRCIKQLSK